MIIEFCFENGEVVEWWIPKDADLNHIVNVGCSLADLRSTKLEDWFKRD